MEILGTIHSAIINKEGTELAKLLSFTGDLNQQVIGKLKNLPSDSWSKNLEKHATIKQLSALDEKWGTLTLNHMKCRILLFVFDKPVEAYNVLKNAWGNNISPEDQWFFPALYCLNCQLFRIAKKVSQSNPDLLKDYQSKTFQLYKNIKSTPYALHVSNNLFKYYVLANLPQRCSEVIQQWKTSDTPIEKFPISQQVTFRYYEGREALLTLNYEEALEKMKFVFENCTPAHKRNKRISLMCLIPLWLLKGRGPTEKLLLKYDLQDMFGELIRAYFQGNVRVFQEILEEKRIIFVKQGTYLIWEQLKSLSYRNLFRRVYSIVNPARQELNLADLQIALKLLQVEMEQDEIECIMANLIYRKYARAYISRERGCVKFDPKVPFPKLSSISPKPGK